MPIDRKNKLAFCHIPRTGGVSVCNALNLEVIEKHKPASWYRKHFPNYTLFAIRRDYNQRVLSAFAGDVPDDPAVWEQELSNRDYIGKEKEVNANLMLQSNEYYLDADVDYVLNYATLEKDLNKMLNALKMPKVRLNKENSFKAEA